VGIDRPLLFAVLLTSCQGDQQPHALRGTPWSPGFLVAGDTAAVEWGVAATDSLIEIPPDDVPMEIRRVADSVARFRSRPIACTRFFRRDRVTAALLDAECRWPRAITDGYSVVGISASGRPLGRVDWPAGTDWAAPIVCPAYRDPASDSAWRAHTRGACMQAPSEFRKDTAR
jgi:hypothetical protein